MMNFGRQVYYTGRLLSCFAFLNRARAAGGYLGHYSYPQAMRQRVRETPLRGEAFLCNLLKNDRNCVLFNTPSFMRP